MVKLLKLGKSEEEIKDLENREGKLNKKTIKRYLFLDAHKIASSDDILKLENHYNVSLPYEYKEFLKKNNGGIPNDSCFLDDRVLNFFFGLFNNPRLEESIEWHLNIFDDRYPSSMLPIASAGGGDLILIGIKDEYQSKIFYWSHDFEAEESGSQYFENIEFISNNLKEFLSMLSSED